MRTVITNVSNTNICSDVHFGINYSRFICIQTPFPQMRRTCDSILSELGIGCTLRSVGIRSLLVNQKIGMMLQVRVVRYLSIICLGGLSKSQGAHGNVTPSNVAY